MSVMKRFIIGLTLALFVGVVVAGAVAPHVIGACEPDADPNPC